MSRPMLATLIGLFGFLLYVLLVMWLADWVLLWHWAAQIPFFAIAGIAWVWPITRLMYWAAQVPPPAKGQRRRRRG
jgi:hypothetical protein